jgi:hypothetical protein
MMIYNHTAQSLIISPESRSDLYEIAGHDGYLALAIALASIDLGVPLTSIGWLEIDEDTVVVFFSSTGGKVCVGVDPLDRSRKVIAQYHPDVIAGLTPEITTIAPDNDADQILGEIFGEIYNIVTDTTDRP